MDRLHGGDDAEGRRARDVIRMHQLQVLDPMSGARHVRAGRLLAQGFKCLEDDVIGSVTDRVHTGGDSRRSGAQRNLEQLLSVEQEEPDIVRFSRVRGKHGRCPRAEGAVREDLDIPQPERRIPESRMQADVDRLLEEFDRYVLDHAQPQEFCFAHPLQGIKTTRPVIVMYARDAVPPQIRLRAGELPYQRLGGLAGDD